MSQLLKKIRSNWKSGLTVSLVAVPLSISLAVAAGATPVQGIVTAIWAGFAASVFAGSNFNIVGPTGALSGILMTFTFTYGAEHLPLLALVSGLIVLAAWALKFERYLIYIPGSAIQGFTLGVAFIIAFNQFNFAFGLADVPKHEHFINNVIESFAHLGQASFAAVAVFSIFFFGLFAVDMAWKRLRGVPQLPSPVLLAPLGIVLGYLSATHRVPLALQTLGSRYNDIAPKLFLHSDLALIVERKFLGVALTIAVIAIIETMLSAKIADVLTKTKHDKRKEMFALGLANVASGFAGGIPATAALARTALNIKSGADDRMSATLTSVFVGLIALLFLGSFKYIPLPVIAAILVMVAIKMVEREHLKRLFLVNKKHFFLAVLVAVLTVVVDPVIGILSGASISLFVFVETLSRGQFEVTANDAKNRIIDRISGEKMEELAKNSHTLVYSLKGHLTYIDGQAHVARFESNNVKYENIVLRFREVYFIDIDGLDAFDEIVALLEQKGKRVLITGINDFCASQLQHSHAFARLKASGRVYARTADALRALGFVLESQ